MFELPQSLVVNGTEHPIRSDYRMVLRVISAFNDPNLEPNEKVYVCLYIIYEDFEDIPPDEYNAAFDAATEFINHGAETKRKVKLVDFEQDEDMMVAAINRVAGKEVRALDYLHWWTFLGYFMEIGECTYSQILSIRSKKSKGKPLEKFEIDFYNENKQKIVLKERLSDEEIEA